MKIKTYNPLLNKMILIATDIFSCVFAISIGYLLSPLNDFSSDIIEMKGSIYRALSFIVATFFIVSIIWVFYRHYTYRKPFWDELKDSYFTLFLVSFFNLLLLIFSKVSEPIFTWSSVYLVLFICFPFFRLLAKFILRKANSWSLPTVIVGSGPNAIRAFKAIKLEKNLGYDVNAFVCTGDVGVFAKKILFLSENEFVKNLSSYKKVFIALEYEQADLLEYWVKLLSKLNFRDVSIVPALQGLPLYGAEISHFFRSEAIILRIPNNLAKRSSRLIKRIFDIIISSLLLLVLSPLFLSLFFIIRADGGDAIYSQIRVGRNKKIFHCYKFRTMVMNSQAILKHLLNSDPIAKLQWEKEFKLKNDPRITKIGKFLRKTSLDELPQLWNVFKGDMSLIGPRPVSRAELHNYGDDLVYYAMVRPGLSGLWQVSGRSDVSYKTRVYLDSWYVKNWSLWNDIVILAKTINIVLRGKGAY